MFTGIIEEIGIIKTISQRGNGASIVIGAKEVLKDIKLGDSIATNGVCLTVKYFNKSSFQVDVMAETMRKSNLRDLKIGSSVNLERALALGTRLGGHLVSGHIDDVGTIVGYQQEDNATWLTIQPPQALLCYMIARGSIAIDGVSLTIAHVDPKVFKVCIIPHTKDETTLLNKKTGELVNLECDLIGKYVDKIMGKKSIDRTVRKDITLDFLTQHGFNDK